MKRKNCYHNLGIIVKAFYHFCDRYFSWLLWAGIEMVIAFEYLYEIPLLQILGVPMKFISLYPVVTGPLTMLMLNLSGRVSDKGSNHKKRKILTLVIVSAVCVFGMGLIVVANFMVLSRGGDASEEHANASVFLHAGFNGKDIDRRYYNHSDLIDRKIHRDRGNNHNDLIDRDSTHSGGMKDTNAFLYNNNSVSNRSDPNYQNSSRTKAYNAFKETSQAWLPLPAVLGIVGLAVMDMNYDVSLSSSRVCILACSGGDSDHSVLLVLALVLAALGGCLTNFLALLDLSPLVPMGSEKGSLIRQATVQMMVTAGVLTVTVICTAVTALFNINTPCPNPYTLLQDKDLPQNDQRPNQTKDTPQKHKEYHTHATQSDETGIDTPDKNSNISSQFDDSNQRKDYFDPLLIQDYGSESEKVGPELCNGKNPQHGSGKDPLILSSNPCKETSDDVAEENTLCWRWFGWRKHKANFITAFICGFLSCSSLFPYNVYATDFLGKVVMGGVPTAPHDSAEFQAYSEGVGVGAKGLLVAYCCYLFFSILHGKILSVLGLKMDFCLSLLLLAVTESALLLTEHVAAYYVCCVVYSLVRTTFYSVPYIIANSYVLEQEKTGTPASGRTLAVLTCMLPLSMVTIFTLSGPLASLTHYPGAPLILSVFAASLGSFIFFILYTP